MKLFVLIMVLGGPTTQSGHTAVVQEFTSFEKCEAARIHIAKSVVNRYTPELKAQGCFEK